MSSRVKQRKSDRIDRLVEHLHERWDGKPSEALCAFLRLYYRGAPAADLLDTPIETLYGAALSAWRFAQRWIPGQAMVRVYNPRLEEHGWHSPHTVIEVVNDDMPFLVDSVTSELLDRDIQVQQIVHPVYDVLRDEDGEIVALGEEARGRSGSRRESFIQLQVHAQPKETYDALQTVLAQVLAHVRASVLDWTAMMASCRDTASLLRDSGAANPGGDAQESADFLDWLCDDNFTFLGFRTVRFEGVGEAITGHVVPDSGLGMLRDPALQLFDGMLTRKTLPPEVHHFLGEAQAIKIVKANLRSPVHRAVLLDIIAVKERNETGHVVNSHLIVGLFTSKAYAATPMDVPILRWKVTRTLSQAGVPQQTHDGRALMHILNTYPRDALFEISEEELVPTVLGILDLQQRPRTALFVRIDPFERAVSCLVFAPRDLYDTALRRRYQEMLIQAWQGELAAFSTHVDESHLARLHLTIKTTPENLPDVDVPALENALAELGRSWGDRLEAALVEEHGEERGVRLHRQYQDAFPPAYRDLFNEPEAVADIGHVEEALETDGLALNLYRPLEADANVLRFKVYAVGPLASLSELVPMLENTGFRVLAEEPYRVRAKDIERPVWIRDLVLETQDGSSVDLAHVRHRFHDTFRQVWQGDIDSDGFNRLVLKAGLGVREISILRAYCRFLLQARIPFSQAYIEQTLASQPEIAKRLVELFCARFDPSCRDGAEAREAELSSQIKALLNEVSNLDMDRIIRRYLEAIRLTLRTNHFQSGADGGPKPYLSFKLASSEMSTLPLPRPYREIFVFGPRVEAVHLRGGKVARGGLRWSDRPEDFRTEILGLMKAQMVKNTVIVPVGSKGGFVVRRLPPAEAGRDAVMAEVIEAYRTMIRGLLDLTDNIEGDRTVPPENVVRHDDDDPYLVVAADKGTATFSDIANGVSRDYGFWLDDAFASGGSAGYDHKKMAITARGAWECVRRHFREMGKDIQTQDFSVVGVGDMGGDVFGNGMLLSEHIRLLGAFNHLHIFLDPTPDAAASYQERKRLFELPRSTWADYDPALMSEGGGVFGRTLKSIPISPQVQKALRIQADELTPNELIHAMLQAPVELMWFGGIGTYVKASDETHAEADDRANDAVRINAARLGAKVVGEGANLALTQRGRVQAGLRGVRLNTDALDNSAGVDCSDHEVNIKILLGEVERAGDLTRKRRDLLLEEMTDEVGDLVLRDNYLQSQAITVAHAKATASLDRLGRFMKTLEKAGQLDRVIEFLPDDETLALRLKERLGLTRPELSVLLSYAKLVLYDELLSTALPDEPWMADEVVRYFPEALRVSYEAEIGRHSLRREIAATVLTNAILNRVGITFVREMNERTGFPADDIARAYIAARDVLGLPSLWRDIEALDNQTPAALQTEMLIETTKTVEQVVAWMLRELPRPLDVPVIVLTYREGVRLLGENLGELLPASHQIAYAGQTQSLTARGAPEAIANRVVGLEALAPGCDIVRIAMAADISVQRAAAVYYGVGEAYGFDWLQRATAEIPQDSAWDKIAVQAVVDDLYGHQGAIAARVLEDATEDDVRATALIERWNAGRGSLVERTKRLFAELSATPRPDLAMVTVAVRQMKALSS